MLTTLIAITLTKLSCESNDMMLATDLPHDLTQVESSVNEVSL